MNTIKGMAHGALLSGLVAFGMAGVVASGPASAGSRPAAAAGVPAHLTSSLRDSARAANNSRVNPFGATRATGAFPVAPARAAGVGSANNAAGRAPAGTSLDWAVQSLDTIGCEADETSFTTLVSGYVGGVERFRTTVDAGGHRYMDEDAGSPSGDGEFEWGLYDASSGGPVTAAFPLPPDTPVTVNFQFIHDVGGPVVFHRRITLSQCNGGSIMDDQLVIGWTVISLDSIGCESSETSFTTVVSGYQGGSERLRTIVDAGGNRYMDEDAGSPGSGNGEYGWSIYDDSSGGPVTASFPLPPDTPVTVHFQFIDGVLGDVVFHRRVTLSRCNGGGIVGDELVLDWAVQSLDSIGCAAEETSFTTLVSGYLGGPERFHTTVDAAGNRYMDEDAGSPGSGNGTYGWSLYEDSSGGPVTASFPLPPDTPIVVHFEFIGGPGGDAVFRRKVVLDRCNGGIIVGDEIVPLDRIFADGFDGAP